MGFFLLPKGSKVDLIVQTGIFALDWVDFYIFVVAMGFPLGAFYLWNYLQNTPLNKLKANGTNTGWKTDIFDPRLTIELPIRSLSRHPM
jgi:hypothetical protein